MITKQNPFFGTSKSKLSNNRVSFSNNKNFKQSFGQTSSLERSPLTDKFSEKSLQQNKNLQYLSLGIGLLAAAAVVVAGLNNKKISSLEKSISDISKKSIFDISKKDISDISKKDISDISKKDSNDLTTKINEIHKQIMPKPPEPEITADGIRIWEGTRLKLNSEKTLSKETIGKIQDQIKKAANGELKMEEFDATKGKKPTIWSVAYEGWGTFKGGEHDVANELPVALQKQGLKDTVVVSPMFKMTKKDGTTLSNIEQIGNTNEYWYSPAADKNILTTKAKGKDGKETTLSKIKLTKIYDEQIADSDQKLQAFYGETEIQGIKQKIVYLWDESFDMKGLKDANPYADTAELNEKPRVAKFCNMVYELAAQSKEDKIKSPTGEVLKFPDKMIAHEPGHLGVLMEKLHIYSIVEEDNGLRKAETAQALRKLGQNTEIIIHNLGEGYQGFPKEKKDAEKCLNIAYGKFAQSVVQASVIAEKATSDFGGGKLARIGFVENWPNAAHASLSLTSKAGTVSAGDLQEIVEGNLAGRLSPVVKLKKEIGNITPLPNGVDKKPMAASKENVAKINEKLKAKGLTVQHYVENFDDKINPDNPAEVAAFEAAKRANMTVFLTELKDAVAGYKKTPSQISEGQEVKTFPSMLFNGDSLKGFHGGDANVDLSHIDPSKPENVIVLSMASRLDDQKGFDTMADALKILSKKWGKTPETKDKHLIMLTSGSGAEHLEKYLANTMEEIHKENPEFAKGLLFTKDRLSGEGLLLTDMTTRVVTPSDFEPFGISDTKGWYAGSHGIVTPVGGMRPIDGISRKTFDYDNDKAIANALVLKGYKPMCLVSAEEKPAVRMENAHKLADLGIKDAGLPKTESIRMDINSNNLDVSWNKGAVQNHIKQLGIIMPTT